LILCTRMISEIRTTTSFLFFSFFFLSSAVTHFLLKIMFRICNVHTIFGQYYFVRTKLLYSHYKTYYISGRIFVKKINQNSPYCSISVIPTQFSHFCTTLFWFRIPRILFPTIIFNSSYVNRLITWKPFSILIQTS